jgi:type III secretory pathway lipoprotein EscJ
LLSAGTIVDLNFLGEGMIISYPLVLSDRLDRALRRKATKRHRVSKPLSLRLCVVARKTLLFSLLSLLLLASTGCQRTNSLATVATEAEAIEILNLLHENGIEASKEEVGEETAKQWRISLHQSWFGGGSEVAMANQVLQDNGLPRPTNAAELANSESGVFKDEATRKAEQLKQREVDLQKQLRLLPGVVGVEVTIVEPEDSSINIDPYPSTASVLIVSKDDPPNFQAETVRGLVARSVPKLNPDSVYVAITTRPVRPLPWGEVQSRRRHKMFDAIGIGIMVILGVAVAVLLLQMKRQNAELMALRGAEPGAGNAGEEDLDQAPASERTAVIAKPADDVASVDRTTSTPALESTAKRIG